MSNDLVSASAAKERMLSVETPEINGFSRLHIVSLGT